MEPDGPVPQWGTETAMEVARKLVLFVPQQLVSNPVAGEVVPDAQPSFRMDWQKQQAICPQGKQRVK